MRLRILFLKIVNVLIILLLLLLKNNVSTSSVVNIFDQYIDMKSYPLPKILFIDEFYLGKAWKNRFTYIFINWGKSRIVDIYPSRKIQSLFIYTLCS